MTREKLIALAESAVHNPNYAYKSREQAMIPAAKSFAKLPESQRIKVQKSWADELKKSDGKLSPEEFGDLIWYRFLAQTNLYFLCHLLEKYNQTTLKTHEDICNAFFVKKDPTFVNFEAFANQYTELKERILLVPRNGFKSSIDIADCVQWVVCYPEVTILILTGVYKLASDFVGELKQHFTLEETNEPDPMTGKVKFGPCQLQDKKTGEWTSSMFQILFPEHCIPAGTGTNTEFQTPAGGNDKEPTVRAASIEQALVGMHFGILKLDDVVTNENSQTISRLETVNKQIAINKAMLNPFGFMDVIGTWYDEQDFYGITIKSEELMSEELGSQGAIIGSVDSGRFNSSVTSYIYLRAAWWPTEAAKKQGKIEAEMKEEDWELWFPERLTYAYLYRESRKPNSQFAIKYLNNPREMHKVKFPRELLLRRTIPHSQLPPQGFVVTTVDTAYSTQSWADYTVVITAIIFGGRFFIVNMVRGRFNEFELPAVIADAAYKWKPRRIAIEESVGVKWMGRELRREMEKRAISIPVEYVSLGQGNKANSKQMKAKPVVRLLGDERMFFSNSCEGLTEIYNELEKFTGSSDDKNDDIVSALSILADQFGAYADMDSRVNVADARYVSNRQDKERHDMMYGLGRYAKYNAALAMDDNPVTQYQIGKTTETFSDIDPLADLF